MIKLAFIAILIGCFSCSEKGNKSLIECEESGISKVWVEEGVSNPTELDLSGVVFGEQSQGSSTQWDKSVCVFEIKAVGNLCSGGFSISNSIYSHGGSGDPGCGFLNGSSKYEVSSSILRISTRYGQSEYRILGVSE